MGMATFGDVVFDCRHPASLARFWAAAMDGYEVAPYDDEELERLREAGIDDPEDDPSVLVESDADRAPRFWFQLVPEPKVVKNRLHVDLLCADVNAEVDRLTELGARLLAKQDDWVTMADPEGNEFDVTLED
jgi:Glyoxalase-like domain